MKRMFYGKYLDMDFMKNENINNSDLENVKNFIRSDKSSKF